MLPVAKNVVNSSQIVSCTESQKSHISYSTQVSKQRKSLNPGFCSWQLMFFALPWKNNIHLTSKLYVSFFKLQMPVNVSFYYCGKCISCWGTVVKCRLSLLIPLLLSLMSNLPQSLSHDSAIASSGGKRNKWLVLCKERKQLHQYLPLFLSKQSERETLCTQRLVSSSSPAVRACKIPTTPFIGTPAHFISTQ